MSKTIIPNYELLKIIGKGSTGEVWLAEYQSKGPLAVKCLNPHSINQEKLSDALVKVFKSNDTPGIGKIYDFNLSGKTPYITYKLYSEAILGKDSQTNYKTRSLEELASNISYKDSWSISLKVAQSLKLLHSKNISHCNLKPSNILFDHGIDPDPKLTDFAQGYLGGLEQINPSESLFYSHPDQLKGEDHSINNNGIRWDIYSFGAVLYKLLTGEYCRLNKEIIAFKNRKGRNSSKYSGISANQVARAITNKPIINWPYPPSTNKEKSFREIIEKCLTIDPNNEFSDMGSIIEEIIKCDPSTKTPLPLITKNSKTKRKENRKLKPSKVKQFITVSLCLALGYLTNHFINHNTYFGDNITDKTANPPLINEQPIINYVNNKEVSDANNQSDFLDKNKLNYLFNDLQESQSALNEICQMIVVRDSDGNALYDFPEGTIGTILTYYEKFIERKENENEPALRDSIITALNNSSELNLLLGDYKSAIEKLKRATNLISEYEIGGGNSTELVEKKAKLYENLSNSYTGNNEPNSAIASSKVSLDLINSAYLENRNNFSMGRKAAKICLSISKGYQKINDYNQSNTYTDQAITLLDEITKDNLPLEEDQYLYASANLQMGITLGFQDKYTESREYLEYAIDQFNQLVTAIPENRNYQFYLAKALGKDAEIAFKTGTEDAVTINDYSIELLNDLIKNNPRDIFKFEISQRFYTFSKTLVSQGEDSAARTQANLALKNLKEIRKNQPSNIEFQINTAQLFRLLTELHKKAGDTEKVIEYCREALSLSETLLETDRNVEDNNSIKLEHRSRLARDYGLLGWNLVKLKDQHEIDEARKSFKESQKIYKEILIKEPSNIDAKQGYQWTSDCLVELFKSSS
mgnify:CR=1 FL=1